MRLSAWELLSCRIMVKYVTYKESKSQTLVLNTIESELYLLEREYKEEMFREMCGTICYALLFNIPDYDLIDKSNYTIEMICFHVPPTLAKSTHMFMDYMSELCVNGLSAEIICKILRIPELTSVILLSHVKPRRLLCCLYYTLGYVSNNNQLCSEALVAINDDTTYLRLNKHYGE